MKTLDLGLRNELYGDDGLGIHSVPQTLEIGQNIGLKVPSEIRIVAVEAKNLYNLEERLTDKMKKAIPVIINKAIKILNK